MLAILALDIGDLPTGVGSRLMETFAATETGWFNQ